MNKTTEIFVPGRLCIFGEHSDWASEYRVENNKIEKGYAIVTGIEEGIYATTKKSKKFMVTRKNEKFEIEMEQSKLLKIAKSNNYYSYVAGVANVILKKYNVSGISINITKQTIPEKKGLSSSAAICVLVAKAFNQVYNLNLTIEEEMELAYQGERYCSKCGKLDQLCAYGNKQIMIETDYDKINTKPITISNDLFFIVADLNGKRNTRNILSKLNECYPYSKSKKEKTVQKYLGIQNKKIIYKAVKNLNMGNAKKIGKLMIKSQRKFDKCMIPVCKELIAPKLHTVLNDKNIKKYVYGGKGVGAQGDGSVQFIAKNEECQIKLQKYLEKELKLKTYKLTIKKNKEITKAIIPLAGHGSRMYPFTKNVPKAFLPIFHNGLLKPAIMITLEELDEAGIDEIALVIDKTSKKYFDDFFKKDYKKQTNIEKYDYYEKKIKRISNKIVYVYQKEKLGLGHAIALCEKFTNKEPVLLVLGDQIFKTNTDISCTKQLLNCYKETKKMTIAAYKTPLNKVSNYGIMTGKFKNINSNTFNISKIVEKPKKDFAEKNLFTRRGKIKEYYSMFGEYIIVPEVFAELNRNISNKKFENNEYQLTSVLDKISKKYQIEAFIPNGIMYDTGNLESYKETLEQNIKQ